MFNQMADLQWKLQEPVTAAETLHSVIGGHPLVAQILARRGITTPAEAVAFLDATRYHPAPPDDLPDMAQAVEVLATTVMARQPILIWGDFDVDGQTATALLLDALTVLGAPVSFYIPHRLTESHGIQTERLTALLAERRPALLLTCDTGITAHDAIVCALEQGVKVVITDHHDLPPDGILPPAPALNPKRLPAGHPLTTLPGVGVAYKLVEGLFTHLGRDVSELECLLDLVALGIVADVAEQWRDTRYLLQMGLERLRSTERKGLRALADVARIDLANVTAEGIGFQLAPRLNAAGRLYDAAQAVELLTTRDNTQARVIAANLEGLNRKRQHDQRAITAAAQDLISNDPGLLDFPALVLYQPGWHAGLLGIVAGELAGRYGRPCILLTSEPGGGIARGSARSAPGYDIGAAIAAQAELLSAYGGHPGAAGLSLPVDRIDQFRRRLSRTLEEQAPIRPTPTLTIDATVTLSEITENLAEELERLAPFGQGNPPVTLMATDLTISRYQTIGLEQLHRKLTVTDSAGASCQIIWWRGAEHHAPSGQVDIAFNIGWDIYQGRRQVALTLVHLRERVPVAVAAPPVSAWTVEDWRQMPAEDLLRAFAEKEPDGLIWAEGEHTAKTRGRRRHELRPAEALLIYTAPPAQSVLNAALETTQARRLYIGWVPLPPADLNRRLRELLGLCRYTLSHLAGHADLDRMAGAIGLTREAILWGLRLLAAENVIGLSESDEGVTIDQPHPTSKTQYDALEAREAFQFLSAESDSYRRFHRRADLTSLLV
ncbi:MAG: single-stranded-DNA-specific exonuclease RecJ [Anaerolineae bacterium]|nr:single-stranded-DNA-specific exonuclease RecJ [Anaerolineae bacterium]